MAITRNSATNEANKFVESDSVVGQAAIAVCNPDGTDIGGNVSSMNVSKTITFDAGIASGKIATAASATLTSTGVAPANGTTVTIGSTVYTFRTTLTTNPATVPYEVLIGVSAATALDNLKLAIDQGATEGTEYSTGTVAHPTHSGGTNADTTQVVTADATGLAGNVAVAASSPTLSWGVGVTAMSTGSDGTVKLFDVTGTVLAAVIGVCTTDLAGATATHRVGIDASVAALGPQFTCTDFDAGEVCDSTGIIVAGTAPVITPTVALTDGQDIYVKVGTASISGGVVQYICTYRALSTDGAVTAA